MNEEEKKNKSQSCAEQLWKEYEPQIRRLCKFKLRSCPDEIDDVVSQTYLSLCVRLDEGNIRNPKGWLYATVNNLIRMTYNEQNKNKKRFISYEEGIAEMHKLTYTKDLLDKNLSNDQIDILKAQVEADLDYNDLRLIHLVHEEHMKYKDIAEIMDSTESAVKQRAYRLRGKVKELAKEKIENFK